MDTKTNLHTCKLCGNPRKEWQVFCGAACCVAWECGIRTKESYEAIFKSSPEDTEQ